MLTEQEKHLLRDGLRRLAANMRGYRERREQLRVMGAVALAAAAGTGEDACDGANIAVVEAPTSTTSCRSRLGFDALCCVGLALGAAIRSASGASDLDRVRPIAKPARLVFGVEPHPGPRRPSCSPTNDAE
jgi:hypothetical protein